MQHPARNPVLNVVDDEGNEGIDGRDTGSSIQHLLEDGAGEEDGGLQDQMKSGGRLSSSGPRQDSSGLTLGAAEGGGQLTRHPRTPQTHSRALNPLSTPESQRPSEYGSPAPPPRRHQPRGRGPSRPHQHRGRSLSPPASSVLAGSGSSSHTQEAVSRCFICSESKTDTDGSG